MKIITLIISIILIYLVIVAFMYLNQRKLLYLPSENNYLDDEIQFDFKEVFIEVESDLKLKSWIIEKDFKKYKTLVFFHGNAGNLSNRTYKLNQLSKSQINILILAYRGFSGNKGEPTEKNLYKSINPNYSFIAFATHAVRGMNNFFLERGLVLTPLSSEDQDADGFLSSSEIKSLNLSYNSTVVLTACNTLEQKYYLSSPFSG